MSNWILRSAIVMYTCSACGREYEKRADGENLVPVGAVCACGGLVGISFVSYNTAGEVPQGEHRKPGIRFRHQTEEDTNVSVSDRDAAAALGINLQPVGGANESLDDDDVYRN